MHEARGWGLNSAAPRAHIPEIDYVTVARSGSIGSYGIAYDAGQPFQRGRRSEFYA